MQPLAENTDANLAKEASAARSPASPEAISMSGHADQPRHLERVVEIDGPTGPDPARYGDWERRGRCIDF
jgi:hypothetical protein